MSTTARAAQMFGLDAARFTDAVAAAGLQSWGSHANGAAVFKWADLVRVAQGLSVTVAAVPRGAQALTIKADRGRANRAHNKQQRRRQP